MLLFTLHWEHHGIYTGDLWCEVFTVSVFLGVTHWSFVSMVTRQQLSSVLTRLTNWFSHPSILHPPLITQSPRIHPLTFLFLLFLSVSTSLQASSSFISFYVLLSFFLFLSCFFLVFLQSMLSFLLFSLISFRHLTFNYFIPSFFFFQIFFPFL